MPRRRRAGEDQRRVALDPARVLARFTAPLPRRPTGTMITPPDRRLQRLLEAGVPGCFLEALDDLESLGDLQCVVRPPDSAYFYLPRICDERLSLAGFEVTPIFDGVNGDTYHVLLSKGPEARFARFGLEADEIHADYGNDFRLMLADLLIDLYEFSEDDLPALAATGRQLGLANPEVLLQALHDANRAGARKTFESDAAWRASHVLRIVGPPGAM